MTNKEKDKQRRKLDYIENVDELSIDVKFSQTQRTNHDSINSRTSILDLNVTFFAKMKARMLRLM